MVPLDRVLEDLLGGELLLPQPTLSVLGIRKRKRVDAKLLLGDINKIA